MSGFFKNCGHFLKLLIAIPNTFSILIICTNLINRKKVLWSAVARNQSKNKKLLILIYSQLQIRKGIMKW